MFWPLGVGRVSFGFSFGNLSPCSYFPSQELRERKIGFLDRERGLQRQILVALIIFRWHLHGEFAVEFFFLCFLLDFLVLHFDVGGSFVIGLEKP